MLLLAALLAMAMIHGRTPRRNSDQPARA